MNAEFDIDNNDDEELLALVSRHAGSVRRVLVAYSGGLDSSVLLHLMTRWREAGPSREVRAVYIHHGLSLHADEWARHCRQRCDAWRVPFAVLPVQVDAREHGLEGAARGARYQALNQHLQDDETLLTAQHLDDQSETFLLALKRGSGPAGLSAMAARGALGRHTLLRPLLEVSRRRLESYARRQRLSWIEDESNQDDRFDRNFLRLRILPALKRRWPHFPAAVARSAQLCAEQEQLLDELLSESLQALCEADGALRIDGLLPFSAVRRAALLRRWLAAGGARMPSRDQLQRLWDEVAESRRDAEPLLQLGDRQIRRFRRCLYLLPSMRSLRGLVLDWPRLDRSLVLPDGLGSLSWADEGIALRAPANDERVTVRFTAQGMINVVGRRHGRPLKKLWQELGVPPWLRDRTPLLFYNEQPIAALGRFITREGQAQDARPVWFVRWRP
ncbi:tRNA lysidine(34) synthetase TilS [Affinibrenneria salicis]|uniref:tRNA(Ile)-lysidine synthase n=1 Tax=Affinibrenneria salicis TaxID=2590031 RepID=A0A5J5FSI9_9GAMM|nr:tRNA lysidine(34) synthetase TilS [Affinibrenneria salicis]KAA8996114.1 tRNA lysidine(34) synthetase TilS [Affinibrenneria salicis]